jgi:hypothetical protein
VPPQPNQFQVNEDMLQQHILKAHHEKRDVGKPSKKALDAVRQFLSGAPGGPNVPTHYWFEKDPPASLASFVGDLEKVSAGLPRVLFEPVIAQAKKVSKEGGHELASNLALYVTSQAGAVAVKAQLDETVASSLVSTVVLALARLGWEPFEKALGGPTGEPKSA